MHSPTATPRQSIYYDYAIHAFRTPPELQGIKKRHPVVIAGAGPIGLALAADLRRYDIPVVVLESELQVSEGSRAIVFTRRSMEILQQVGIADRISAAGLPWRFGNSHYRGQRVFRLEAPYDEDDRYWPMINLQQQYLEEYLVDRIASDAQVDLRWGSKVIAIVKNDASGTILRVDTPEGEYDIEADWVVACDGARSAIRGMTDLRMEGDSYEGRFVIADIRIDLNLPTERLAFFDPEWNPGNTVLMHREPHGIWRVDYQLPAGETPEEALRPESLKSRIDAQLAMIGHGDKSWEMDWCSVYSARAMTLPDYCHGKLLFCGDAAHMLPIFGVRGANTGWQDSHDLGWKLAMQIKGLAGPQLLASYSHERVGAAREIIDEASKSTRFMTPPSHGFRTLRDATLSLTLSQEFAKPLLHWRTSRPHDYLDSPLNTRNDDNTLLKNGPADGAPLRNVKLGDNDYLFDHLGASFHLLYFGGRAEISRALQAEAKTIRAGGVPFVIVGLSQEGAPIAGVDLQINDTEGRAHAKYGNGRDAIAYLVRPDQHVCARWINPTADRLRSALNTALGQENAQ
jgi:3-(3-hydroxy-phenyl)propionate hydroxylase